MGPFLFFMIIWIAASALGIFLAPPFFEDVELSTIIVWSVAISWVLSFITTIITYISQLGERASSYPGGPANYMLNEEPVKGFLRFPPDFLLFIPSDYEIIKKDMEIKYKDIVQVSFGPGSRELLIEPKKGKKETFLVSNRAKWKRYLDYKVRKAMQKEEK